MGGGVKNFPKFCDVIYGQPLNKSILAFFNGWLAKVRNEESKSRSLMSSGLVTS